MSRLFASLEELEEVTKDEEDVNTKDKSIDDIVSMKMEADELMNEIVDSLEASADDFIELESIIERLEALGVTIRKYGISQAIMEAADPHNELVAAGICGSYEELGKAISTEAYSETTLKNIDTAIEGIFDSIGNALGKAGDNMRDNAIKSEKANLIYTDALTEINKKLSESGITFDEAAFGKKSIRAYSKDEMKRAINALDAVDHFVDADVIQKAVNEFDKFIKGTDFKKETADAIFNKFGDGMNKLFSNKDAIAVLGLEIVERTDNIITHIKRVKPTIDDNRDLAEKLGWSARDAHGLSKDIVTKLERTYGFSNEMRSLSKLAYDTASIIYKRRSTNNDLSKEQSRIFNYGYGTLVDIFTLSRFIVNTTITTLRNVASSALEVSRAALASKN